MLNKLAVVSFLALVTGLTFASSAKRWYTKSQVVEGEVLFKQDCADCHGQYAEATVNWKQTDANGQYPPPPLNGTAHAWHHGIELLRKTVREGGAELGGTMPGFSEKLSRDQVDSVIAYFQSKWPDDIYKKWSGRFEEADLPTLNDSEQGSGNIITRNLRKSLGNAKVGEPQNTVIDDVWRVKLQDRYVYLLESGKYAMIGDLLNLEDGQNLTENYRRADAVDAISEYTEKDMITYKPASQKKASLTVFTDTSCPYCQKLHEEIPELLSAGIEVRYLPYARGGSKGPGYQTLKSVWCAKDRNQALTNAKNDQLDSLSSANCPQASVVDRAFKTGGTIGISGTPALFKSNGEQIVGYVPYQQLIPRVLK
ncbi:MAG: thioredoxin fold domain-containing protein [Gammaproteobacteria bacterium]|nr:thioredoxin fold domain-containing protein [Gammaproteobacteria bacterium]